MHPLLKEITTIYLSYFIAFSINSIGGGEGPNPNFEVASIR